MDSIQDRVQHGAALLDQHRPEWWKIINLDELRMDNTCNCVLGQCYGTFDQGKLALDLDIARPTHQDAAHGFEYYAPGDYRRLQNEWVRVITERRQQEAASA